MAYSKDEINKLLDKIFNKIVDGESLNAILKDKDMPCRQTFYNWIEEDQNIIDKYARATKARADYLFEQIIEIADKQGADMVIVDGEQTINHNIIQRNRLQIDARKWVASKMNPKKYGEKLDITSDDKPLVPQETTVTFINARKKDKE